MDVMCVLSRYDCRRRSPLSCRSAGAADDSCTLLLVLWECPLLLILQRSVR
jgi:hypothetical protein